MGQQQVAFDADIFARTASIFAAKRDVFAPAAVESLAKEVVRRLAHAKSREVVFESPIFSSNSITAFCDALVQPSPEAALRFIEERRAEGVTRQGVYLGYIIAAADCLGKGWDNDEYTSLDVTYGTGHLYALMRSMRAEAPATRPAFDHNRYALFATVPGEDHGIGVTVAADMFREVGWEIDLQTNTDYDLLIAHIERTQPHIICLSLSTAKRIDSLARLVVSMRIIIPDAIIGVALGASINAAQLSALLDIDLIFHDVPTACRELGRLIKPYG